MKPVPCPSCGYDLRAQATRWGAKCPECGNAFSAEELEPRREWRSELAQYIAPSKWILLAAVVVPPIALITVILAGLSSYWDMPWPLWLQAPAIGIPVATPVAHLLIAWVCGRRVHPPWPWWAAVPVALLLTAMAIAFFYIALTALGILFF